MKNPALYFILLLASFCVACEEQDVIEPLDLTLDSCQYKEVLHKAVNQKGVIAFDPRMGNYNVYSGVDGSYDTQTVGVACNLPKEFQVNEVKVVFSGNYFEFEGDAPVGIVGQNFLILELEKIELAE